MNQGASLDAATAEKNGYYHLWNRFRSHKTALFALAGFLGGMVGDLITEPFLRDGSLPQWIHNSLFGAGIGSMLAPALAGAAALYQRRPPTASNVVKMVLLGALGGALSEVLIATVYRAGFQLGLVPGSTIAQVYRCVVWGISGGMIGGLTAHSLPNLRLWRAIFAGLVGGAIGCLGFLLLSAAVSAVFGRLLGFGVQGLAIGLSIVVAEKLAREASLEIIWAPNEVTFANLGERPVFIGGGREDDVFVRGYPPRHAGITLKQGRIEYVEAASGRQATLKNASKLEIGKLTLVVHTDTKN